MLYYRVIRPGSKIVVQVSLLGQRNGCKSVVREYKNVRTVRDERRGGTMPFYVLIFQRSHVRAKVQDVARETGVHQSH